MHAARSRVACQITSGGNARAHRGWARLTALPAATAATVLAIKGTIAHSEVAEPEWLADPVLERTLRRVSGWRSLLGAVAIPAINLIVSFLYPV